MAHSSVGTVAHMPSNKTQNTRTQIARVMLEEPDGLFMT